MKKENKKIKACFHLQRTFVKIGNAMARNLKEKYGVEEFCALVATRWSYSYLLKQQDINYTTLILDEDIHDSYKQEILDIDYIKNLEKEYGLPNLWPYLMVDRVLMSNQLIREYPYDNPQYSHEELMRILQTTAKKIIKFLDEEKPDFIFFSVMGNVSSYLLHEIAKKRGTKIIFGELSRFPDSYMITNNFEHFEWAEERFQKLQSGEDTIKFELEEKIKSYIKNFYNKPVCYNSVDSPKTQPINRKRQLRFLLPDHWLKTIKGFYKMFYDYYFGFQKNDYTTPSVWHYILDRVKRKLRMIYGFDDLYDDIDEKDNFVYFSLSVEPETTLLLNAPFASNQLSVIKNVARSLPVDYKLYVKEHPSMMGYRTRKFYKEIKKMPNIKLIRPEIMSFELIKKARLITTVTGTAGWEALFFQKPSITFGNTFYNCLSMVEYCENPHKLPQIIKNQLTNFKYNEKELINFIAAILEDTVKIDMVDIWYYESNKEIIKNKISPLVDLIAVRLGIKTGPIHIERPF